MPDRHQDVVGEEPSPPDAVPGLDPTPRRPADARRAIVDVDGELFEISEDGRGGTSYEWLSGPNPGYGFGCNASFTTPVEEHVALIRDFLRGIDPRTGYMA